MSLYRRGKVYWSRIVRRGIRSDRSTRCRSRSAAIKVEAAWLNAITESGDALAPLRLAEQRRPVTLVQLLPRIWASLEPRVAASTLQYYKQHMRPLVHNEIGVTFVANISADQVELFTQNRRLEVGVSSVNGSLRTLRRALHLAMSGS